MPSPTRPIDAPQRVADAFPGQRVTVVPRPQVDRALWEPATRQLTVVDAGYYPRAADHFRRRATGTRDLVVLVCTAGSGVVEVAGATYAVGRSMYVVLPAFTPHAYRAAADDPWTIWWVHLRGAEIGELSRVLMPDGRPVARVRSATRAVGLIDELITLLERRLSPAHLLAASGIAWQLLTRLAADAALPADDSPLERAIRFLEERTDGVISVGELASLVGLSSSHLGTLFRRATGAGPAAFHTQLKMARARALLDGTARSVQDVAAEVGYADALYFSRLFRRHHGLSPTAYRAQSKG